MDTQVTDWRSYAELAYGTAIYPGRNEFLGLCYTTSGLPDEVWELWEALQTPNAPKELSDCAWYFVNTVYEANIPIQDIVTKHFTESLDMFKAWQNMMGPSCKINGIVKKILRDNKCKLTNEKRNKLKKQLVQFLDGFYQMCALMGYNYLYILQMNIDKLYSRKERGVLNGSGDNR